MNKFFDTAIGKSVRTAGWIILAYAVAAAAAWAANYHWSTSMIALGVPGLVNWLLYTAKVLAAKEVPNLPNSPPMLVIPKVNPVAVAPNPAPVPTPIVVTEPLVQPSV